MKKVVLVVMQVLLLMTMTMMMVVLVVMVEMVRPSVARLTTQVKVEESRGKKLLEG
jgi:hypothetical protein